MDRHLFLILLLVFTPIMVSGPVKCEVFTASGLVDIPTGAVLKHGIFTVGSYFAVRQNAKESAIQTGSTHLNGDAGVHFDFGLFDRTEFGLGCVWREYRTERSPEQVASLKVQLLKEPDTGKIPNVAVGIEYPRDGIFASNSVDRLLPSVFLAVSKTFNLPRVHQFSGHIGVGTQRFAFDGGSIGLFAGVSKEFQPAFARGDITMSMAFDGAGVNAGIRYSTSSGLQTAFGAETLNDSAALRYLASVSWTNAKLLEQIDETKRLLQRATQLAVEAKRATEKKADE